MPKVTKETLGALLRRCAASDPSSFETDGKVLVCKLCDQPVTVKKMFQFNQHISTDKHARNAAKKREPSKQALIKPLFEKSNVDSEFYSRVCKAFMAANIPFNKLEHKDIRALFKDYCGKDLPHESTLRKNYVTLEYDKVLQRIREEIGSHPIWLSVDETTDTCGRYMANVIVGKLSPTEPGKGRLILCKELDAANHATIVRTVQEAIRLLWPVSSDVDESRVLAFLTDAAPYMLKAGKHLQVLYPKMIHVTCLAHALHRVAEAQRDQSPGVNSLISYVKRIFVKAPSRVRAFKQENPHIPLPPEPILTRWGTWISAAMYYADHLQTVKK